MYLLKMHEMYRSIISTPVQRGGERRREAGRDGERRREAEGGGEKRR
jgi:hypothetical protein